VVAIYAIAKDLREAYDILTGRPVVLHYIKVDGGVRHYVKEVCEESQ
jgi:hypothetical protein